MLLPFPFTVPQARARRVDIALRALPAAALTGWRAARGVLSAQADIIDNQSEMKAMLEQVLSQVRLCCRSLDQPRQALAVRTQRMQDGMLPRAYSPWPNPRHTGPNAVPPLPIA